MNYHIEDNYKQYQQEILSVLKNFDSAGTIFIKGQRNTLKTFSLAAVNLNIKSFKVPNFIQQVVYRFFRKSKARRSFDYAKFLQQNAIGTPNPIAYLEHFSAFGLGESYYVSEHLETDLTFRELVSFPDFPEHERILRQFTAFSYNLHQNGIEFLDHSPGNTLIKKTSDGVYSFFLVDLNRMKFHKEMSLSTRMKNLSRLTPKKDMVAVMSNEYAKLSGENEAEVFRILWQMTSDFQERYHRKKRLKKKLKLVRKGN